MAFGRRLQNLSLRKDSHAIVNVSSASRCLRCGGLLVHSDFLNLMKGTIGQEDMVIRCVQCGDLVDRIIFNNRSRQLGAMR